MKAIDECAGQLISFVQTIRRHAIKKDRILRGDGINFPSENDAGWWEGTSNEDIMAMANALKSALPDCKQQTEQRSSISIAEDVQRSTWWQRHQWWIGPLGLGLTTIGVFVGIFPLL